MVLAYMPEWNHGDGDNVAVANNEGGVRALFAWKPVPPDLTAKGGRRVYLALYSRKTTAAATGGQIAVEQLSGGWPERTSWQSQPKTKRSADALTAEFTDGDGWKLFDVTSAVADRKTQHGVMLKFTDETRSDNPGHWSGYAFVSREADGKWSNKHPRLLIVDTDAAAAGESKEVAAWVKRIKGLRDHMHTAFGVGPDITLLDPELGLEIVRQSWPQVRMYEVKTGLLKTFAFSKALPEKHPKVLQVLDLGMNDSDPKVRDYAASYLEDYSTIDFQQYPGDYAAWYAEYGQTPPEQLLAEKQPAGTAATAADEPVNVEQLIRQGWQEFFSGSYSDSEQSFQAILKEDESHLAAMNGLGFSLLNQGKVAEAKPYFDKILAIEPDSPGPLNGKARCLMAEGKTDEAIEVWEYAHELSPEPNDITAGLARAYMKRGDYAKAVPLLEELVANSPENVELQQMLETAQEKSSN
jgi:hypothetical protein